MTTTAPNTGNVATTVAHITAKSQVSRNNMLRLLAKHLSGDYRRRDHCVKFQSVNLHLLMVVVTFNAFLASVDGTTIAAPHIVKPGLCPPVPIGEAGICETNCRRDNDCARNRKCCYNGCSQRCEEPGMADLTTHTLCL